MVSKASLGKKMTGLVKHLFTRHEAYCRTCLAINSVVAFQFEGSPRALLM